MAFVKPESLYLLLVFPLLGSLMFWSSARRQAALARFGDLNLTHRLSANISWRKRRIKIALQLLSLALIILAAARPQWGTQVSVKVQEGVQVLVVLDVSSSMLAEDIKPSRLERAKLTISELMARLGGNELGLVIFSGAAFVQFPVTADFYTARSFLSSVGPTSISRPGTALEQALSVALDSFVDQRASSRVILLLTDGEGHEGDPLAAANRAAEEGVIIHAIGFGSPTGEPIPLRDAAGNIVDYKKDAQGETVVSRLDEVILQQITRTTGGAYFRANASGKEVVAVADRIEGMVTGEQEEEGGAFETSGIERYQWFVGLAFSFLVVDVILSERYKKKRDGI
ncbi:MAG: VWA domain-containing protein [Anaerolineae bacterium]|nr:VWA domain-containing protein [Anaerolineae bacterium]